MFVDVVYVPSGSVFSTLVDAVTKCVFILRPICFSSVAHLEGYEVISIFSWFNYLSVYRFLQILVISACYHWL